MATAYSSRRTSSATDWESAMMNILPYIDLSWDASEEPAVTFIRYNVYRRPFGVASWTRIAIQSDRNRPHFDDYNAWSGVDYQYTVTVVKSSDNGEEIEGDYSNIVSAQLFCRSIFLHDIYAPQFYVELLPASSSVTVSQEQVYLQARNRQAPTLHIGALEQRTLDVSTTRDWETDNDRYKALALLMQRQRTNGAKLLARGWRFGGMFCQVASIPRNDSPVVYGLQVSLLEVTHSEAV